MKKFLIRAVSAAAGLAAIGLPMIANAESNLQTGTSTLSATARLDFSVVVPKVLYLRVGTGTALATLSTIDAITFTVPAANLGDSTAIAAGTSSGDLGSGVVTAKVIGNNGAVTLTSTTLGALSNGTYTLSYAQISTAASVLTSTTALAAPALADGATTSTTVAATSNVVNRDAKWTFSFLNTAVVPAGTYGGVNTNNSRVTYTASMP